MASRTTCSGLTSGTRRNFPLETFGLDSSPYSGAYVQDFWKVRSNLTLGLGLRYEYWHEKTLRAGNGATFDPAIGKVIAGVDENGQVNLTNQPVSPFLAASSQGLWVPATEVGVPAGLFKANGHLSPRVGVTWRPEVINDFVVRGGYGIYYNSFTGNRSASSIVGLPYWTWEALSFSPLTQQGWETAWPTDPQQFIQPSVGESPDWDIDAAKTHEWNVSVQKGLPFNSAVTVSYVATRLRDQVSLFPYNEVPPGTYPDLQAAKPYPAFGEINVLENRGTADYDALQIKWERRFADGLSFTGSYSLAKNTSDTVAADETGRIQPFAPAGYLSGRAPTDRRHMLWINAVYELPFGRDRRFLNALHPALERDPGRLAAEWHQQLRLGRAAQHQRAWSNPGQRLGNPRQRDRRSRCGRPVGGRSGSTRRRSPRRRRWRTGTRRSASSKVPARTSSTSVDEELLDRRHAVHPGARRGVQRAQPREPGQPGHHLGTANFGRILSAGAARTMQFGLKLVF